MLELAAGQMGRLVRERKISSVELIQAHLRQIDAVNPELNAAVEVLRPSALAAAERADAQVAAGELRGPLHGVPFSVKDSMNVAGTRCTAGTVGFRDACLAAEDATVVSRLRAAGGIPIAKTNLPDLLFSFETDNLLFGRTNNPYDASRTPGGSSGGESALIAACGSPLGLGSDCAGSVRLPAAFCGIAGLKPTSGRLPRTGHVPPAGGWVEHLWQIGPMARFVADVQLAYQVLAGSDEWDWTTPPAVSLHVPVKRAAFLTHNGIVGCTPYVRGAVARCAAILEESGISVEEKCPAGMEECYELELAILGADGGDGINNYLKEIGSHHSHPFLQAFVDRTRPYRATASQFAQRWAQWDRFRAEMMNFFATYDVLLGPVYTQAALPHGESVKDGNFEGFSYTMAWNVAGFPAATVRCGEYEGLPVNVQVVAKPWHDLTALQICKQIEEAFGGWQPRNPSG